ncbi:MAG: MFS transporter [Actinomycetota bacterium]|nr:MFS transporter [Actinomycetota bacterium]
MSPTTSYKALFAISGRRYIVIAFLARLPLAMSQLGVLLLVAERTGSYAIGGGCAGALALANAIGAPLFGNAADRIGQRPIALTQSISGAAGLIAIVALSQSAVAWPLIAAMCAATGLMLPQVGPLARVRWRPIIAHRDQPVRLVDTAFSYEGAADEASFVLGPAFVGIFGAFGGPQFALEIAAVVLAVFGVWFAVHPTAALIQRTSLTQGAPARLLTPAIAILCVAQLLIGSVFGSVQTGTTVIATNAGYASITGLFHALLGVGSVLAGVGMAAVPATFAYADRLRLAALALFALSTPLLLVDSLATLIPVLLILGCCVAPYMITTFTLAEVITPMPRVGAAMTLLAAATGLGYACGTTISGYFADEHGATGAFAVTVTACVLGAALAVGTRRPLLRASSQVKDAASVPA